MKQEKLKKDSIILLNKLLKTKIKQEENSKIYYMSKINCVIFPYRIIKSKDDLITNNVKPLLIHSLI